MRVYPAARDATQSLGRRECRSFWNGAGAGGAAEEVRRTLEARMGGPQNHITAFLEAI